MTYLSGKAQQKRRYIQYGVSTVIFFCIAFFWPTVRRALYPVVEPAVVGYSSTKESISLFPEFLSAYLTSHKALASKQQDLELEIERLENALAEKDALLREKNTEADSLLDASSSPFSSLSRVVVMYPLAEDVTHVYSTILLSRGFKDGLTVGNMVYVRGHQVVCTIKEVYTSSSLCLLLTSSGEKVEGVTSSSSIVLPLVGRGGHFLADIARDTPVSNGEIVYLRSDPKMVLGTVRQVLNNNQDTSWHVFVEGAYNPVTSSVFYVQP
jgi:cell shape-determining protein MreC